MNLDNSEFVLYNLLKVLFSFWRKSVLSLVSNFSKKFVFFIVVFFNFFCLYSNPSDTKEVIRVGYREGYVFVNDMQSNDKKGYGYDLLKEVEKNSNFVFEFVDIFVNQGDAFPSDKIDVLTGPFTELGSKNMDYINPRIGSEQILLTTRHSMCDMFYNDPSFIDGKTVALYEGLLGKEKLDNYLAENNISVTYVYGTKDDYLSIPADFYIENSSKYNEIDSNVMLHLGKYYCSLGVEKGNSALQETLSTALTNVILENFDIIYDLKQKYPDYSESHATRLLTENEHTVLRSKALKIGYNDNCAPYQFTNDEGEPAGFSVAVMQSLLDKYSIDAEFIPYNNSLKQPSSQKFDILLSVLGDKEYIERNFTATDMYYEVATYFAHSGENKNFESLAEFNTVSKTVGCANYISLNEYSFFKLLPTGYTLVSYDSFAELLDAYKNNEIDNALFTRVGVEYFDTPSYSDVAFYPTESDISLHFFISNDIDSNYVTIFNILLNDLGKENIDFMYIKETSEILETKHFSYLDFFKEHRVSFIIILLIICSLICLDRILRLRATKKTVLNMLNTDALTGVSSLHYFTYKGRKILAKAEPNEYEIITIDVDYFRTINMYMGTDVGTNVIKAIAKSLSQFYDNNDVLIARVTGDEFVILKKVSASGFIQLVCMHTIIPALEDILGEKYHLSLSIGICKVDDTSIAVDSLIGRSNMARMKGKKVHKTTFYEFDKKMLHKYETVTGITQKMENALTENEFFAVYQPKVDLNTLKVCGAEALVRWRQCDGSIVCPDDFIPLFETNGFIIDLDIYMFEHVCNFIDMYSKNMGYISISVNLSGKTLEQIPAIESIISMFNMHSINPAQIEIEITESAFVGSHDIFLLNIEKLKKIGFCISIDDFGAGTSTLNRLTTFNADTVKLDKVFLDIQDKDKKEYIILEKIISMTKKLNMKVVAEGVENSEQVMILKEMGCDIAQGYFFEKQLDKEEFVHCIKENKTYSL